jgi:hypothetical protein
MPVFRSKRARNRALVIQVGIVAVMIAFYKFGVPRIEAARARAAAAERELNINAFFQSVAVEAGGSEAQAPEGGEKGSHPKRLQRTPDVREVEQQLGAPDESMTGYGGAEHLTWIGTRHKLQGSFNKGQLYALTIFDLQTGHGEAVFESSAQWRAF